MSKGFSKCPQNPTCPQNPLDNIFCPAKIQSVLPALKHYLYNNWPILERDDIWYPENGNPNRPRGFYTRRHEPRRGAVFSKFVSHGRGAGIQNYSKRLKSVDIQRVSLRTKWSNLMRLPRRFAPRNDYFSTPFTIASLLEKPDSRFHENDWKEPFQTFCEMIKLYFSFLT